MPDEVTPENLQKVIGDAISKLRTEFIEDRVERAARMMESLRNVMMLYMGTLTVLMGTLTVLITICGILGLKGWSDIRQNRADVEKESKQVQISAGQATKLVTDASNVLESARQATEQFKKQVGENNTILAALRTDVKNTSNSLGVLSSSLKVPLITSVYTAMPANQKLISGFGFGTSGRLFVRVSNGNPSITGSFDLGNQAGAVEIPLASISSWSDKVIVCYESEIEKLTGGKTTPLQVQVVTSSGAKSNVYSAGVPPAAPTGASASPQ